MKFSDILTILTDNQLFTLYVSNTNIGEFSKNKDIDILEEYMDYKIKLIKPSYCFGRLSIEIEDDYEKEEKR